MRRIPPAPTAALLLVLACTACTEDPITSADRDAAPGASSPTIEMVFDASVLPLWRDTTYEGFVTADGASFQLAADTEGFAARPLGRFSTLPDSVFVDTTRAAVESFSSAVFRVSLDTARSVAPEDGVEVVVWGLARSFDENRATWEVARQGEAWTTPGGDLDVILGIDTVSLAPDDLGVRPDTFTVPLLPDADSLLTAWRDSDGEPGIALVATGTGTDLRVLNVSIVAEAVPEGVDTTLTIVRGTNPSTFIYRPPTPSTSTRLRLAGIPAARFYLDFELPDSVDGIELRGSTINRAALEFVPTAAASPPFTLTEALSAQAVRLLADPFQYGEKTPIGQTLGPPQAADPGSLAEGTSLKFDISPLIRLWSQVSDSIIPLRVGIVPLPENRELAYWEFFSAEDAPGVRPVVRILFTPNPSFLLP